MKRKTLSTGIKEVKLKPELVREFTYGKERLQVRKLGESYRVFFYFEASRSFVCGGSYKTKTFRSAVKAYLNGGF